MSVLIFRDKYIYIYDIDMIYIYINFRRMRGELLTHMKNRFTKMYYSSHIYITKQINEPSFMMSLTCITGIDEWNKLVSFNNFSIALQFI